MRNVLGGKDNKSESSGLGSTRHSWGQRCHSKNTKSLCVYWMLKSPVLLSTHFPEIISLRQRPEDLSGWNLWNDTGTAPTRWPSHTTLQWSSKLTGPTYGPWFPITISVPFLNMKRRRGMSEGKLWHKDGHQGTDGDGSRWRQRIRIWRKHRFLQEECWKQKDY